MLPADPPHSAPGAFPRDDRGPGRPLPPVRRRCRRGLRAAGGRRARRAGLGRAVPGAPPQPGPARPGSAGMRPEGCWPSQHGGSARRPRQRETEPGAPSARPRRELPPGRPRRAPAALALAVEGGGLHPVMAVVARLCNAGISWPSASPRAGCKVAAVMPFAGTKERWLLPGSPSWDVPAASACWHSKATCWPHSRPKATSL